MGIGRWMRIIALGVVLGVPGGPAARAEPGATDRALVLEAVELEGATRTSAEVVLRWMPIAPGDAITPDDLLDAISALRAADLFAELDFRTERGSARGNVRLILIVREHGLDFRLGTGYRDQDGWYLIPGQLRWDNLRGRGDQLRAQIGIGYRLLDLRLLFEEPRIGVGGRWGWGAQASAAGIDRRYFVDGVSYHHGLSVGALEVHLGRRFGSAWRIDLAGAHEVVDADSMPTAAETDELRGVEKGDPIPTDDLPAAIRDHVGRKPGNRIRLDFSGDSRAARQVSLTPSGGFWGRLRVESILREDARAARIEADLRAYRRVLGGAGALRLRGGIVEETAAFYDRFYLGGPYTVRGFPTESLSPAEGDTRYWTASAEFRGRLAGPSERPRFLGSLFVDAGQGWRRGERVDARDIAVAVGWGVRLRIPWIDSLGVDFGIPLTESPTRTAWHGSVILGWNY
jgi:outer membrane protein insertion porin family